MGEDELYSDVFVGKESQLKCTRGDTTVRFDQPRICAYIGIGMGGKLCYPIWMEPLASAGVSSTLLGQQYLFASSFWVH